MMCAYCGNVAGPYLAHVNGALVCHTDRSDDCYRRAYTENAFLAWAATAVPGDPQWGTWRDREEA